MDKQTDSLPLSRLSIVNDPRGRNGKVYRAYLTAADVNNGDNRAEWNEALLGDGETARNVWGDGAPPTTELWIGWRSLFGSDVLVDRDHDNDGNYMQLKGDSDCGGPAVGMTIKYGRLTIRSEQHVTATDGIVWNGPLMSTLLDNQWHDVLMHVNFAKDQTGYVEVWLDGVSQRMTNGKYRRNFPTVCPDDTYVFPKFGVYGMDQGIGTGPAHWVESPRIATTAASAVPHSVPPDAPTAAAAVAGNGRATVSWTAPAFDGGSPITGYVVTPYVGYWSGTPRKFTSTATTQTVTGLTNGWTYRFRVQAVNAVGVGGYSKVTNAVTPTP
jgi:Polysaccharide lyase/Fibronectin type III domain